MNMPNTIARKANEPARLDAVGSAPPRGRGLRPARGAAGCVGHGAVLLRSDAQLAVVRSRRGAHALRG